MQKDPLVAFLSGALCLAALGVFILAISCEWRFRQMKKIAPQVAAAQQQQQFYIALANDALEYSKHNPAINPILQSVNLPVAKPAAK